MQHIKARIKIMNKVELISSFCVVFGGGFFSVYIFSFFFSLLSGARVLSQTKTKEKDDFWIGKLQSSDSPARSVGQVRALVSGHVEFISPWDCQRDLYES